MRTILIGGAALLVGVGGGTVYSGNEVKNEILQARADSVAAAEAAHARAAAEEERAAEVAHGVEDTPTGSESADSAGAEVAAADGHAEETGDDGPASEDPATTGEGTPDLTADASGGLPGSEMGVPPVSAGAEATSTESAGGEGSAAAEAGPRGPGLDPTASRKMAKIFGAMKAPDAAAVLQEMTDPEVEAVLLNMSERNAAAILGSFEASRAARLSRLVLAARSGGDA